MFWSLWRKRLCSMTGQIRIIHHNTFVHNTKRTAILICYGGILWTFCMQIFLLYKYNISHRHYHHHIFWVLRASFLTKKKFLSMKFCNITELIYAVYAQSWAEGLRSTSKVSFYEIIFLCLYTMQNSTITISKASG